jgi:hypothetical protein
MAKPMELEVGTPNCLTQIKLVSATRHYNGVDQNFGRNSR